MYNIIWWLDSLYALWKPSIFVPHLISQTKKCQIVLKHCTIYNIFFFFSQEKHWNCPLSLLYIWSDEYSITTTCNKIFNLIKTSRKLWYTCSFLFLSTNVKAPELLNGNTTKVYIYNMFSKWCCTHSCNLILVKC